jgi:hypothetical protein
MRETLKSTMVWLPDQRETKSRNLRFQREREREEEEDAREVAVIIYREE